MKWKFWGKPSGSVKCKDNFPNLLFNKPKEVVLGGPLVGAIATLLFSGLGVTGGITIAGMYIGLANLMASLIVAGIGLGLSMLSASLLKPKIPKLSGDMMNEQSTLESGGTLVNTRSIGEVVRVLYGQARIGGNIVFMHSKGEDNKALHIALTWSEGPIEGVVSDSDGQMIWMDDRRVSAYETVSDHTTIKVQWDAGVLPGTKASGGDVTSTSGMEKGQRIMIELDNGDWHYSKITDVTDSDTIKIADAIPAGRTAEVGDDIYFNWKDLVNYHHQYGTITGDAYCTLAAGGEIAGATAIDVDSTERMKVNEVIWFALNDGDIHSSTIASITDANTVVIADAIPANHLLNDNTPIYCLQVAEPHLTNAKAAHTDAYRGTAYSHFRLVFDQDAWASMPLITAQLKGRRLYDPRTPAIPSAYSNNLALVVVDWMTNERYGMGIPYSLFDDDSVIDAANWCDTEDLTFDGLVVDRQAFTDNLSDILLNGKLLLLWSAGTYKFVSIENDSAVMNLNEDDIVKDSFQIEIPGVPETPNRVKLSFLDEDDKYRTKNVVLEEGNGEQYPLTDNEARQLDITFIGLTDYEKVLKQGTYHLIRARRNKSYSFAARKRAIALEPGDMVNVTHNLPGWEDEKIRVTGMSILNKGQIQLTCMEENSDIYDQSVLVTAHTTYDTTLPGSDGDTIQDGTGLDYRTGPDLLTTADSHDAYIVFKWDYVGAGYTYKLHYRKEGDPEYIMVEISEPKGKIGHLVPGDANDYLVRDPDYVQYRDAAVWTDESADAIDNDVNDVNLPPNSGDESILIGDKKQFNRIKLVLGTAGAGVWEIEWQYWNGTAWTALENVYDGSGHFMNVADTYYIDFNKPSDWEQKTVNSQTFYWVRAVVKNFISKTTQPLATRIYLAKRVDPTVSGTYTGESDLTYVIEIDGEATEPGTAATFKWSDDGGSTWDDTTVDTGDSYHDPTYVLLYDASAGTYTDDTTDATDVGANDVALIPDPVDIGDALYIGHDTPFDRIIMDIGTAGVPDTAWAFSFQWYGPDGWKELSNTDFEDQTYRFKKSGTKLKIKFNKPAKWESSTVDGKNAYWIRIYVTDGDAVTTQPLATQIWVKVMTEWQTLNNGLKVKFPDVIDLNSGDKWTFTATSADPVKYRVGKLPPKTTIFWKVKAFDAKGNGSEWAFDERPAVTWGPITPSMKGYTPDLEALKQGRVAKINWSTWHGAKKHWFWDVQYYNSAAYTDIWSAASADDTTYFTTAIDTYANNKFIELSALAPFGGFSFKKGGGVAQAVSANLSVYYYNGSTWTAVKDLKDGTKANGKPLQKDGIVSWTIPTDWEPYYIGTGDTDGEYDSTEAYYQVRVFSSAALTAGSTGDFIHSLLDHQVKHYNIYQQQGATCDISLSNKIAQVKNEELEYKVTGLTPGITYNFRILPVGWAIIDDENASQNASEE